MTRIIVTIAADVYSSHSLAFTQLSIKFQYSRRFAAFCVIATRHFGGSQQLRSLFARRMAAAAVDAEYVVVAVFAVQLRRWTHGLLDNGTDDAMRCVGIDVGPQQQRAHICGTWRVIVVLP